MGVIWHQSDMKNYVGGAKLKRGLLDFEKGTKGETLELDMKFCLPGCLCLAGQWL